MQDGHAKRHSSSSSSSGIEQESLPTVSSSVNLHVSGTHRCSPLVYIHLKRSTAGQEANIAFSKKEPTTKRTGIPSSNEQSETGTSYQPALYTCQAHTDVVP
jgi:hypothetical protein